MRDQEFHSEILRIKKYSRAISIVWLLVVIALIFWDVYNEKLFLNDIAKSEAVVSFNKAHTIKEWASKHGGIYVPMNKRTPANSGLSHISDRDIIKPSGDTLTLLNPAFMLRQIFKEIPEEYGVIGRIVSLRPLNSQNTPDKWEKKALLSFEKGENEVLEFTSIDGKNYLRLIRPMVIEKSCLKCHANQGFKVGDISGGISVAISMEHIQEAAHIEKQSIALMHSILFLFVFVGIKFSEKRIIRGIKERNEMEGAAKEQEHLYQTLFEESPIPMWEEDFSEVKTNIDQLKKSGITDFRKYFNENKEKVLEFVAMVKIIQINKAVLKLHEANSKEEILKGLSSIFTEESFDSFIEELIAIADGNHHCEFKTSVKTLRGVKKFIHLKWLVLSGYEDTLERVYISTIDITESKKTADILRRSKDNLASAQKIAKVGSWEWDLVSNDIIWSDELRSIYGIDENYKIKTETYSQFIHKEDKTIVEKAMGLVNSNSPLPPLEYRIVLRDGTIKHLLGLTERFFDNNGNPIKAFGTVQDITERKANEAEIIKLTNAIEQSINSIMITDTKGNIEYVNRYFTDVSGYSKEEVIGRNPRFLKTDYHEKSVYENMWKRLSSGNTWTGEFCNKKKNGELYWEKVAISPIKDSSGNIINYVAVKENITEWKKNKDERLHLEKLVKTSVNEIYIFDKNTYKFTFLNDSAFKNIGYSFEELKEMTPIDIKPEVNREEFKRFIKPLETGEKQYVKFQTKHQRKDKSIYYVDISLQLIKHGDVEKFAAIIIDITKRKEQEKELEEYRNHLEELVKDRTELLKESEETFRALAENSDDTIIRFDREYKHLYVNPVVAKQTGIPTSKFIGKTHEELGFKKELCELWKNAIRDVFETKRKKRVEFMLPNKTWIDWNLLPELSNDGKVNAVITFGRDVTERKKVENSVKDALEKEKELNELKDQFMSTVSHDLRTPLTAILSSVELMENFYDKLDKEQVIKKYGQIKNSVSRITDMLSHVLELSRIERGNVKINFTPFNLKKEFQTIIDEVNSIKNENHQLIYNYKLEKEIYDVDINLLREILINLLVNGVKYSPKGGKVELLVEQEDKWLLLQVSDEGIGINQNEIGSIFNDFYRTEGSQNISGSGLGLSIVKHYVEMYNGKIEVESKFGMGSVFRVKIPLSNNN